MALAVKVKSVTPCTSPSVIRRFVSYNAKLDFATYFFLVTFHDR